MTLLPVACEIGLLFTTLYSHGIQPTLMFKDIIRIVLVNAQWKRSVFVIGGTIQN